LNDGNTLTSSSGNTAVFTNDLDPNVGIPEGESANCFFDESVRAT